MRHSSDLRCGWRFFLPGTGIIACMRNKINGHASQDVTLQHLLLDPIYARELYCSLWFAKQETPEPAELSHERVACLTTYGKEKALC